MRVYRAEFHQLLMKQNSDNVFEGKLKALLAVPRSPIKLLYRAKNLNFLNLVHRKVLKTFQTGVGEF